MFCAFWGLQRHHSALSAVEMIADWADDDDFLKLLINGFYDKSPFLCNFLRLLLSVQEIKSDFVDDLSPFLRMWW